VNDIKYCSDSLQVGKLYTWKIVARVSVYGVNHSRAGLPLFNLRRDHGKGSHNANVYEDWALERPYIIFGGNAIATKFLSTLKDFPPSQKPGSFNLEDVKRKMESKSPN
jgi:hypothetical protein